MYSKLHFHFLLKVAHHKTKLTGKHGNSIFMFMSHPTDMLVRNWNV